MWCTPYSINGLVLSIKLEERPDATLVGKRAKPRKGPSWYASGSRTSTLLDPALSGPPHRAAPAALSARQLARGFDLHTPTLAFRSLHALTVWAGCTRTPVRSILRDSAGATAPLDWLRLMRPVNHRAAQKVNDSMNDLIGCGSCDEPTIGQHKSERFNE